MPVAESRQPSFPQHLTPTANTSVSLEHAHPAAAFYEVGALAPTYNIRREAPRWILVGRGFSRDISAGALRRT